MSEDYVQWDVHATTDVFTPRNEFDDPLSQFSEENRYYSPYATESTTSTTTNNNNNNSTESNANLASTPPTLPPIIPSSSPIIGSSVESDYTASSSISTTSTKPIIPSSTVVINKPLTPVAKVLETVQVQPMTLVINDPQKHHDGAQNIFITYQITTETSVETFSSSNPRPVRRRFQDFVWLHTALSLDYPACIIPPLPEKHRLEYIKGDRFSSEFTKRRQLSLQWFLDRLAKHPVLQKAQSTRIFLESTDFKNDKRTQVLKNPPTASLLDTISDTLVNAYKKLKKPDDRFEEMKELVNKMEDNLNTVERLYTRINKRQQDLQNDYISFANSIQGLSSLETNISKSLHQFAETSKAYSKAMKEMTEMEEMQFLNEIHELLAYCYAAKDVLKARDQKQLDFEELTHYLHQTMQEKERTQYPGRKYSDHNSSISSLHIADYVTDKLNEVRGINMERARREKLNRLEKRVKELGLEVTKCNDESNEFSNQVVTEFEIFQKNKTLELKQGLMAYADCHIKFYEKGVTIWEQILPVLESIDKIKGDF